MMRKLLAVFTLILFARAADAATLGPVYPAPGGTTYSSSGSLATNTLVGTYSGFDLGATDQLYWGANSIQLSMDGAYDSAGETLSYNAGLSNLAAGTAVYTGSTRIQQNFSYNAVSTVYTVQLTDLSNNAIAFNTNSTTLGISGAVFPLFEVTSNFKATQTLTANGTAYRTFFDNAPNKTNDTGALLSSVTRSFFYTENAVPEPATWAMMVVGFGLIGGAVRRQRATLSFG